MALVIIALIVVLVVGIVAGWCLCIWWLNLIDDVARDQLPPELRAEIDAYRAAERMTWLTAHAIRRLGPWLR